MLKVVETFTSIEGEGPFAGLSTIFIRLHGCNYRCSYCDTKYSYDGKYVEMEVTELLQATLYDSKVSGIKHVSITGGEPLLQDDTMLLVKMLEEHGIESISIETNGSRNVVDLRGLDSRCMFVMDVKCPTSDQHDTSKLSYISDLRKVDAVKFVVGSMDDLYYMEDVIKKYPTQASIYVSPVADAIRLDMIADFIMEHKLVDVRMQVQLHKIIWDPNRRGV